MLVALALGSALLVAVPVWAPAARLMMGKLELRGPFGRWAVLQLVPSMYNFTNVVRVEAPGAEAPSEVFWLNHYPLRALTYTRRIELSRFPATVTTETRYGSLSVATRCRTEPIDGVTEVRCEALP
jgi:hypothetical protein